MKTAIIYDCEFLTAAGSPSRFWCGPQDPDPVIAQIGAVRLGLDGEMPVLDTLKLHVLPRDRAGDRCPLDPLFIGLTGITEAVIDSDGLPLADALATLDGFSGGAGLWSWGKDEFNMVAISCYVQGLAPPIPVTRFRNVAELLLKAGVPLDELSALRSNLMAGHFGIERPELRGHDGLDDALSVAFSLQHLLQAGRLGAADFD